MAKKSKKTAFLNSLVFRAFKIMCSSFKISTSFFSIVMNTTLFFHNHPLKKQFDVELFYYNFHLGINNQTIPIMKIHTLLLIVLTGLIHQAFAQTELTDRKKITYARGVKDWQGNVIDTLALDLYYPTGATSDKKYPAVMFLHGGSFTSGSRANVSEGCDLFSEGGFVSIAIDYRVGYQQSTSDERCTDDTTQIKEAIYRSMQDANAAWRFISANAAKYNIDTAALFVAGASAGAELAYFDSYVNDSVAAILFPGFAGRLGTLQTSGNNFPPVYTIKGICGMWGAMPAMPGGIELINASYRVFPTILYQGGVDFGLANGYGHFAGCDNYPRTISGSGIYDRLIALDVPSVYHFAPKAGHEAYDDVFCINQALCFFKALINHNTYSGYYTYYNSSCH